MLRSALLSSLMALTAALPASAQDEAPPPAVSDVGSPQATVAAPAPLSDTEGAQGEPAPSTDEVPPAADMAASGDPMADSSSDAPPPSMTSVGGDGDGAGGGHGANNAVGHRFYIAPMGSYAFADRSRDTDDGYGGTLAIGKKLGDAFALELTGFYNRFSDNVPGGNGAAELFGGGLSLLLSPLPSFRDVYAIGNVQYGITKNLPNAGDDSYDSLLYGLGLGYLLQLTDAGTALRVEALYRWDSHDAEDANGEKDFYDPVFNIGLMIPIGGQKPEVTDSTTPAAVVPVSGGDDDNDGVPNETDQCPATPPGAIVNAQGCENDEDGDGVVDRLDRCPGTPAGTAVNEEGCPAAAVKSCTTPAPGQAITLEGCAAGDTIVLQGVTFEFNQARLTANAKTILDGVGDALVAKPEIKVEVGGHTDAKGSDDYNQKLSESRASSVQQYLVGRGIDSGRLSAEGYGETMPIADNETDDGRELNRRVELKIVP